MNKDNDSSDECCGRRRGTRLLTEYHSWNNRSPELYNCIYNRQARL